MFYTAKQAAERIGVSVRRIRQIAEDSGTGEKVGRDWVFTDADIDRMRQRNTTPGPKGPRTPKEGSE